MRYLSLFSGVGGFELGIQNAYRSQERGVRENTPRDERQGLQPKEGQSATATLRRTRKRPTDQPDDGPLCIGYSEIDKYAIATYEHNWKGHINYGDCTTINPRELPDFDLVVGGFPCQAFSVAGKRKGFDDTRGTLFFDIARILKDKRPRHLVLENVKGLLSHDSGKTFQTILGVLTDLGYDIEWQVLNAKDFGVPQNRERIFIVGHLRGECTRKVFPIRYSDGPNLNKGQKPREQITNTLRTNYGGGYSNETYVSEIKQLNQPKHSNDRIYADDGISPTLNTAQGGNRQPFIPNGARIRRLTPTECERLMSWPDGWTIGSDTQRYKQCGNGVVSNVVQAVIESMKGCLDR